ncbi:uncharacterized protein LOC132551492 isoform X2 [Ylistrum balloti]|nr:uncharacterized protein LOC132551492 isoform X2 [Ylistrum balloti]
MSTAALQCLSTTVCASLPEPIHPCALLPPNDPDAGSFPDIYNSIQQFKLSKPTWSDYTERCLFRDSTERTDNSTYISKVAAVTTKAITTTQGETTSVYHTVTHTLTETVTNVTIDVRPGTVISDGETSIDWVIPVAIVGSLVIIIAIVFIVYKTCHHAKSFHMFTDLERIVIRKSSTKQGNNTNLSYHDMFLVVGCDSADKGGNAKAPEEAQAEAIVGIEVKTNGSEIDTEDSVSISITDVKNQERQDHDTTSDSGVASEENLQTFHTLGTAKSKEQLVKQDDLCPDSDDGSLAVVNVSFTKDNGKAEYMAQHLTKHTNSADEQNSPQQSTGSDQREQDVSNTIGAEEACVSEMEVNESDKDQSQSKSNNIEIPFITDIKSSSSLNTFNHNEPQPKVDNVFSHDNLVAEGTDIRESSTPKFTNENSNILHNESSVDEVSPDSQDMEQKCGHSIGDLLLSDGVAIENGIQVCGGADDSTDYKNGLEALDNADESVVTSLGNSNSDSNRTSSTIDSRKSDLRSDLENLFNNF